MRVLLDTNVLASAVATRGLCADVLRAVLAEHELIVSRQIITELRRVLRHKFGVSRALIRDLIWLIQQDTVLAKPGEVPDVELGDQDDLGILAAAVAAEADIIVTGDKELQHLEQVSAIQIMSPRQFWETLTVPPTERGEE
jgi:putative PIN family toxin of toxin-antitoxin system